MKRFTTAGKCMIAAAAFSFCAVTITANASSAINGSSVSVKVTDLDLSNPDGIDALVQRLSKATRQVCGNSTDLKIAGSLKRLRNNKACFDATMSRALERANVAQLNHFEP